MKENISSIYEKIKSSKKYKNLPDEVIKEHIGKYFRTNNINNESIGNIKTKKLKLIIKHIKADLHKLSLGFENSNINKREYMIKSGEYEELLNTNKSTKERLLYYSSLYEQIFEITGNPKIITDIGCGLNPISIIYMKNKPEYYAYDINQSDMNTINEFFEKENIKGKAETLDISKLENIKNIPKSDICFMFKLIDPLENAYGKGHKLSEQIINIISEKSKYIIISFATKTLTGKNMNHPQRGWIERMLSRLNYKYNIINTTNEIYYVVG